MLVHRSNAPVQCTGPMHRSNAPVQCTGPMHWSNAPVQCTCPMHLSNAPVQYTCPVHLYCRGVVSPEVMSLPSHNISFNCLVVDQWSMGRNYDKIFLTIDQGPGQVPLGDQGSGRGSAGECQLCVNGQFLSKTGTKSLNFCLKSA